jgi:RNA polymerase sigma factor, sigma-70 family/RNA polymerase sigma-70 factor, Bacteroides expansion family 1
MAETDLILFKRVLERDHAALKEIFLRFHPRMFSFAYQFTRDEAAAKDIVQDTFISFWEHCSGISAPMAVPSYIFKTLKSICLKHLRLNALQVRFDNLDLLLLKEMELACYNDAHNILDDLYFEELNDTLSAAVESLPPRSREIFTLSRNESFSHKDIARKLNISVRTVENEIYRSLKLLKLAIKDYAVLLIVFIIS